MNKPIRLVALTIILACGLSVPFLPAAEEKPEPSVTVESLAKKLELYEKKIELLEQRVAELEQQEHRRVQGLVTRLTERDTTIVDRARQAIEPRSTPKGWKPFEFNGQTIYFVPLGKSAESAAAAE